MIRLRPFAVEMVVLALILVAGGLFGLPMQDDDEFEVLENDLRALREAFNARPENVRAILLAAPT
jgi:hypothetical protein